MSEDPAGASLPAFEAVWRVVSRIPRGRVATYGQVALMAGLPGAARVAGWAMRALPDGLRINGREVPWHRVINAQGMISPRRGARGDEGAGSQGRRLRREGVAISGDGRIDLEHYRWSGRPRSSGRGRRRSR